MRGFFYREISGIGGLCCSLKKVNVICQESASILTRFSRGV